MDNNALVLAVFLMGGTQYLLKMIPLVFLKKKVENKFLSSFLFYIPYAVLTSMTIPEIFNSTSHVISASVGALIAVILGLMNQGLIVVSLSATVAVFIVEKIMNIF
ncbi:MAG: AzlD domain-containing protein [Oscillospiraceae bacterium]|jgi:branched-subunit amino acid transport protein|nr:AzlD domain-containing protein [Oscillospiraceae bacterium]